ncbi:DMT family transporter [Microvirga guangxiensis]|uniref:Permease of the drug/metabolite transporter (DMT) superfamily n=1 Tax=Microvirga guangxiensis TaxID=549386 RepID=A0A1G5GPV3_9HYPH|nr:DMT family transporter [Microvirga guangxiensis]SCY53573.1 Permease of the drug/metabolite transporter (DMT) superfamily [Microvirga guangxiensis]
MTIASKAARGDSQSRNADQSSYAPAAASPVLGILFLIASTVFFSLTDIITKHLTATLPVVEIAWIRYATFSCIVAPIVFMAGGRALFRTKRPGLQVLRSFGMVGSTLLFTQGLRYLPVAESTAIYFISPILIMALSILFLGESVGWRRWIAAGVGLIGVLVVIRPGTSAFQSTALLPLLGATSWAAGAVVTRKMSGVDHHLTTLVYSAVVGCVALTVLLPFNWVMPQLSEIGFGLAMGLVFTIGQWFVVLAYRHGNASVIAPFSYVQLIWAGILGYLVFGSLPDGWTVVGACIIAASGLYTAYRERLRMRQRGGA